MSRLEDPKCPSGGYLSLYTYLSRWWNIANAPHEIQLHDRSIRKAVYVAADVRRVTDTWTYTADGPSANMQDAFVTFHRNALSYLKDFNPNEPPYQLSLDLAENKKFELKDQVPAVRVACLEHQPLSLEDGPLRLAFPKLDQFAPYRGGGESEIVSDVTNGVRDYLSAGDLAATSGRGVTLVSHAPSLLTIPLDITAGDASSLGLLLLKQINGEGKNIAPLTCTVDARWANATSVIEAGPNGILGHGFLNDRSRNVTQLCGRTFRFNLWFDLLSPRVSDPSLLHTTGANPIDYYPEYTQSYPALLDRILGIYPFPGNTSKNTACRESAPTANATPGVCYQHGKTEIGEHNIGRTSADLGSKWQTCQNLFETTGLRRPKLDGDDDAGMVFGYAMTPQNWFDYVAIILLLTHVFLAFAHTIWSLWRGETSEAWDTIPELVALSQQSPPAPAPLLDNTCAGARSMRTMGHVVRVEPSSKPPDEAVMDTLHLTFRKSLEKRMQDSIPKVEAEYSG
ncbi:uncharacterized protein BDW70DRAFT_164793 [Aspergillus foveolatus]|uniref:uncharacterized protein n=1 Tax=Aspergillus foveolatus TaxID=210207 RepID=UPI003CCDDAC8